MGRYVRSRVAQAVFVVFGVLVITFVISHMIPGDPARLYAGGAKATPQEVAQARKVMGLDKPLWQQFITYVAGILHGDFGQSYVTKRPVIDDIGQFLPNTLELVVPAMALAILVGLPIGTLSGARPNRTLDRGSRVLSIAGSAIPVFWLALIAQLIFVIGLGWLPIGGQLSSNSIILHPVRHVTGFLSLDALLTGNWTAFSDSLKHLVLPVLVLAVPSTCLIIRQTRASVSEAMKNTYVLSERASGIAEREIVFRFVLKNAVIPALTVIGLTFAGSLIGAVLIEVIFSWPGVGQYMTSAISASDFAPIIAVTVIVAVSYVGINLVVDLIQAALDPRVRN